MTHGDDRAAYERAVAGKSRLLAVWPGELSGHLFVIDDLDEYANGSPRSPYISVDITLDCGCKIHDRRAFAAQMKEQHGWDMAKSGGWSISGAPGGRKTYSLRVRRKSLTS